MKTGCPRHDLPEPYGNWKTVYNRFANWSRAGHFERIFKALRLKVDKRGSLLSVVLRWIGRRAGGRRCPGRWREELLRPSAAECQATTESDMGALRALSRSSGGRDTSFPRCSRPRAYVVRCSLPLPLF